MMLPTTSNGNPPELRWSYEGSIPSAVPKTIKMHTTRNIYDHTTGRDLYIVLASDGFDALGEGFETIEEAQKIADELNREN